MAAERALNFRLRAVGGRDVERDFRKVGEAGEQSFEKVRKAANGANQEVSEYTARLRRVVAASGAAIDRMSKMDPQTRMMRIQDPAGYQDFRRQAVLEAVQSEQDSIRQGLPETTQAYEDLFQATEQGGASLGRYALRAAAVSAGLLLVKEGVQASLEAWQEHEAALNAFEAELGYVGNRSSATADEIEAMADRIVAATTQTRTSTLDAAQQLAAIPGMTKEGLDEALNAAALFADKLGRDVADVVSARVVPVFQALADKDMPALIEATKGLEDAQANMIVKLAAGGKAAEAQRSYLEFLREKADGGADSLTQATNNTSKAWERFKRLVGEDVSGPAIASLNAISGALKSLTDNIERTRVTWDTKLSDIGESALPAEKPKTPGPIRRGLAAIQKAYQAELRKKYEAQYSNKPISSSSDGGRSKADREADRLKRAADQARTAADRIAESNHDVLESYRRRADEVEGAIGLEGAALQAYERHLAIEAAARRINTDEIEKEVAARRAAAAAQGLQFDEAAATLAATEAVEKKRDAIRSYAAEAYEAARAQEEFNQKQKNAATILDALQSPLERINEEVQRAYEALRSGRIESGDFDRYMDLLARDLAAYRESIDETAQAWVGFGDDVGRTLSDLALNGGTARDILQSLIRLPLERLLEQNVTNPVADWIDSLTGTNVNDNIAAAHGDLQDASRIAAAEVTTMAGAAGSAAAALNQIPVATGNPIAEFATEADAATAALGGLVPLTGQLTGAFGGAITTLLSLGRGGGGSGGFLSGIAGLIGRDSGGLVSDVATTIAENPSLFASGTDRVPANSPFYVGENGRELMELTSAGLKVHSHQETRRREMAPAGPTVINTTINIPERADPRRTQSTVNRGIQTGLSRATRKGLAR